jgi:hypothetical protein
VESEWTFEKRASFVYNSDNLITSAANARVSRQPNSIETMPIQEGEPGPIGIAFRQMG